MSLTGTLLDASCIFITVLFPIFEAKGEVAYTNGTLSERADTVVRVLRDLRCEMRHLVGDLFHVNRHSAVLDFLSRFCVMALKNTVCRRSTYERMIIMESYSVIYLQEDIRRSTLEASERDFGHTVLPLERLGRDTSTSRLTKAKLLDPQSLVATINQSQRSELCSGNDVNKDSKNRSYWRLRDPGR